ncbi:hypothetical protein PtB15_4B565 [Puccinia triticina]|nr:hypothetical protein PtB15_4B565 [Puccinia triticina]
MAKKESIQAKLIETFMRDLNPHKSAKKHVCRLLHRHYPPSFSLTTHPANLSQGTKINSDFRGGEDLSSSNKPVTPALKLLAAALLLAFNPRRYSPFREVGSFPPFWVELPLSNLVDWHADDAMTPGGGVTPYDEFGDTRWPPSDGFQQCSSTTSDCYLKEERNWLQYHE